jgi:hypothetical protein
LNRKYLFIIPNRIDNSKFSNGVYESPNGAHYFPPATEDLIEKSDEITFLL